MKFKIYYNKNLKMSEGKIAAQVAHVSKQLGRLVRSNPREYVIIVLGLSATKFDEMLDNLPKRSYYWYMQQDNGLTEVPEGTITACGFIDSEKE